MLVLLPKALLRALLLPLLPLLPPLLLLLLRAHRHELMHSSRYWIPLDTVSTARAVVLGQCQPGHCEVLFRGV